MELSLRYSVVDPELQTRKRYLLITESHPLPDVLLLARFTSAPPDILPSARAPAGV